MIWSSGDALVVQNALGKLSRFGITVTVADLSTEYPRDGDQFIMQVLLKQGYPMDILLRLKRVRVSLQLLFMSDIPTATGHKVNPEVLLQHAPGDAWSSMRWPTEHPTDSDFLLWRNALLSICPSRSRSTRLGRFTASTHRIWRWTLSKGEGSLHHLKDDGIAEEVFVAGKKPNRFHYSHSQPRSHHNIVCLVEPTLGNGSWHLTSSAPCTIPTPEPESFLNVLRSWGNTWLWENLQVMGGISWLHNSIADGLLIVVTDGSYIREWFPNLCLATFILECSNSRGQIVGSFSEVLLVANAHRGERLGLMAIHLILLSINKLHKDLAGSTEIVLDCLGALKRVTYLPPYWIPSKCRHSDILKTILVHCRGISFTTHYSHVAAHQDNKISFANLGQKVQLNCICDHTAKQRIAINGFNNPIFG